MNEILKIIRNLKAGKKVIIAEKMKRYAMMGLLEAYGVHVVQDGAFISIQQQDVLEEEKS